jgi:CHASE3 domain sensor protein
VNPLWLWVGLIAVEAVGSVAALLRSRGGVVRVPQAAFDAGIGFAAVAATACFLTTWSARESGTNMRERAAELGRLDSARVVLADLAIMESGQRGYLMTGSEEHLEPYRQRADALGADLDWLASAWDGDPDGSALAQELRRAALVRRAELARAVAVRARGDRTGALSTVRAGEGVREMRAARQAVTGLETICRRRLDAVFIRLHDGGRHMVWAGTAAGAVIVFLIGFAGAVRAGGVREGVTV